jgi:hypothetical protein
VLANGVVVGRIFKGNAAYFDDTLKPIPLVISHAYSNHYAFGRPPALRPRRVARFEFCWLAYFANGEQMSGLSSVLGAR